MMRAFLRDVLANFAAFWIDGWLGRKGEDRGKGDYTVDPFYQWVLCEHPNSNRVIGGDRAYFWFSEWTIVSLFLLYFACWLTMYIYF